MFFRKKANEVKCEACNSRCSAKYRFCPYCGESLVDLNDELEQFGMLGRSDLPNRRQSATNNDFGMLDGLVSTLMKGLMKSMTSELEKAEVTNLPNGIRIQIGSNPVQQKEKKAVKKQISEEQIKRMSNMPRVAAKTNIKRIGDKLIYELAMPGVVSSDDIFVSKLESGYEVKAIGEKKVYVNSLPVNLPIKNFIINPDKVSIEFLAHQE